LGQICYIYATNVLTKTEFLTKIPPHGGLRMGWVSGIKTAAHIVTLFFDI